MDIEAKEEVLTLEERLEGPHEWGYRDLAGPDFITDNAPYDAAEHIRFLKKECDSANRNFIELSKIAKEAIDGGEEFIKIANQQRKIIAGLTVGFISYVIGSFFF